MIVSVLHVLSYCSTVLAHYFPGADPENVEPGGANSVNYQNEPKGGGRKFICWSYI